MNYNIIPVTSFQQNCTLLNCPESGKAVIIDPGGDIEKILAELSNSGSEAEKILLTHGHLDHVGAAAELSTRLNIPIIGPHKDDLFWLEQLPQQQAAFGLPGGKTPEPAQWLEHGDTVSFGQQTLNVLHCPGHTPGHVVFYHPESKLAQVGDVLFRGSIGRTDFPGGNHQQLIDSIKNRLFELGDDVQFIPGHGPMSSIGRERKSNPFLTG